MGLIVLLKNVFVTVTTHKGLVADVTENTQIREFFVLAAFGSLY
jgi:hypothetical protein